MMNFLTAKLPGPSIWEIVIGVSSVYELLIILSIAAVIGLVLGLKNPMKVKALIFLASLVGYLLIKHTISLIANF